VIRRHELEVLRPAVTSDTLYWLIIISELSSFVVGLSVFRRVPLHVKKIAGKTMPLERHGAARAEQFLKDYRIPLPIFELFYGWNLFQMTSKNEELSLKHLELVQMELSTIRQSTFHS
jgi:hypothetical protein